MYLLIWRDMYQGVLLYVCFQWHWFEHVRMPFGGVKDSASSCCWRSFGRGSKVIRILRPTLLVINVSYVCVLWRDPWENGLFCHEAAFLRIMAQSCTSYPPPLPPPPAAPPPPPKKTTHTSGQGLSWLSTSVSEVTKHKCKWGDKAMCKWGDKV